MLPFSMARKGFTPPSSGPVGPRALQRHLKRNAAKFSRQMVGTVQRVPVEGESKKNGDELCGRTGNNRVVNFRADGAGDRIGQFVNLRITEALLNGLRGRRVS